MSAGVHTWWVALCVVSAFNVCAWAASARALALGSTAAARDVYALRRWQLLLSAVFVLVCAFRSVLPRADVQRICLHDTWLASVMVGRSVATLAELSFVAQWALLLHEAGRAAGVRLAVVISWFLVPLIAVAETASWSAVLTTCYLGNVVEESIWTLTATLLTVGIATSLARFRGPTRHMLVAALVCGCVYVAFMCTVDVPMYWTRWRADAASGRAYMSFSQGVFDLSHRWVVTGEWEQWREEMPWMSLYFSAAVWISISLAHMPSFERAKEPDVPAISLAS